MNKILTLRIGAKLIFLIILKCIKDNHVQVEMFGLLFDFFCEPMVVFSSRTNPKAIWILFQTYSQKGKQFLSFLSGALFFSSPSMTTNYIATLDKCIR